jgi:hypothetical protein
MLSTLAKMLSGTNAFEISDIQEAETEGCASPKLEAHLKSTRCKEAV